MNLIEYLHLARERGLDYGVGVDLARFLELKLF